MSAPPGISNRTWANMAFLAVIWGGSFLAMKVALAEVPPLWIAAHRVTWAALLLTAFLHLRGKRLPRDRALWIGFLGAGLLNNVIPFALIAWGQQHVETGLTAILNSGTAIWGVLFAALLLADESLTPRRAIGVLIGFAGVVTAIGLAALASLDLRSVAQLAILGAGVSYALSGVWTRKRLQGLDPIVAAAGMLLCSTALAIPLAWVTEGPPDLTLSLPTWTGIAYFSVGSTAIAYLLYFRIIRAAGSGNAGLVTLLVAPVAITLGAVVRSEVLAPTAYAGFVLIALGLLVLDGRLFAKKSLAKPAASR